jgi:hypothetical protein
MFVLFCRDEPLIVTRCSSPVLSSEAEYVGVAKRFFARRYPSLSSIEVGSTQAVAEEELAPARLAINLVLNESELRTNKDGATSIQKNRRASIVVSICGDVVTYQE